MRRDIRENKSLTLRRVVQKAVAFLISHRGRPFSPHFPPRSQPLPGHFQLQRQVHEQLRTSHQKYMTP